MDTSAKMENRPKWFEGAKVNFGENMLKFRDEHAALIAAGKIFLTLNMLRIIK